MKKQCTCTPTDLMPFGECICGFRELREVFDLIDEQKNVSQQLQDDMMMYGFCISVRSNGRVRRVDPLSEEAATIRKYDK